MCKTRHPPSTICNRMELARIAELLQPFLAVSAPVAVSNSCHSEAASAAEESAVLSNSQLKHIWIYIDLLCRWNARINLTAVREPEQIVTRHFGESLFAARWLFPHGRAGTGRSLSQAKSRESVQTRPERSRRVRPAAERTSAHPGQPPTDNDAHVIDIGSGAGFPGLPIKIWAPSIRLTLIEANQKKATFLREVARALTLTYVNVFSDRAEDYAAGPADVVTLRAVERFENVLPSAAHLVAPGGRLALQIGEAQCARARELATQFRWADPLSIPLSSNRMLLVGERQPGS